MKELNQFELKQVSGGVSLAIGIAATVAVGLAAIGYNDGRTDKLR